MRRKLLAVAAISLLACGCTQQHDDSAEIETVVDESLADWPTTPDEPPASVPGDVSNSTTQDRRDELLQSVSQAFHAYHEHFGHFPPAASTDVSGKRLLSWRVHILPFIDEYDLYQRFHLDESWDSAHNRKLVAEMPAVYQGPGVELDGHTSLMVFTGNNTVFGAPQSKPTGVPLPPYTLPSDSNNSASDSDSLPTEESDGEPTHGADGALVGDLNRLEGARRSDVSPDRRLSAGPTYHDLTDGTSNTLLAVYAGPDKSVPWSKPEDLPFQPEDPVAVLGSIPDTGILAVFWDSQVKTLPKDIDRSRLKSFIDSTELAREEDAR